MSLTMKYFVLKPHSKNPDDPYAHASREAMKAYADAIECSEPNFAQEIRDWRTAALIKNTSLFGD